ncbi:MAG TPA: phosphoribosylaminoimidazolesuccinocarboxamide synthase [Egibacteraceae bacterium]|nr:phosphoribosylaminoimidazolesuccinocarboxamide synthase [Egibacteraceae bacterium]
MIDLSGVEGLQRLGSGKVRELYAVDDDTLLLVASDRISAFDVVLPTVIPDKGRVLTAMTAFWLDHLAGTVADHRITTDVDEFPPALRPHAEALRGRSMLCRRAQVLPVECVARGYLAGSGWKEYRRHQTVCGIELPAGLRQCAQLPEPIFTPATKAELGAHDENISFERMGEIVGDELAKRLRDITLTLYSVAAEHARSRGIILADTKFEFGMIGDELLLIDEVLTPDSSRFWPADAYKVGRSQPSFDKQFVRDWLQTLDWPKTDPGPELPPQIVAGTRRRYVDAYERLSGRPFDQWNG